MGFRVLWFRVWGFGVLVRSTWRAKGLGKHSVQSFGLRITGDLVNLFCALQTVKQVPLAPSQGVYDLTFQESQETVESYHMKPPTLNPKP